MENGSGILPASVRGTCEGTDIGWRMRRAAAHEAKGRQTEKLRASGHPTRVYTWAPNFRLSGRRWLGASHCAVANAGVKLRHRPPSDQTVRHNPRNGMWRRKMPGPLDI